MIWHKSSREYNREKQERRLVYLLFLHTLIFHNCWCITLTSLSILLPILITATCPTFQMDIGTLIAVFFVYIFLFWKFCINSSAMSKDVSEPCGSICLLREEKKKIPANGWNSIFHPVQQKALLLLFCYYLNCAVVHFLSKINLEHNLPFTLWDWQFAFSLI